MALCGLVSGRKTSADSGPRAPPEKIMLLNLSKSTTRRPERKDPKRGKPDKAFSGRQGLRLIPEGFFLEEGWPRPEDFSPEEGFSLRGGFLAPKNPS